MPNYPIMQDRSIPDGSVRVTLSLEKVTRAAEQGNVEARFQLGKLYDNGDNVYGLAQNYKAAVKWYTLAAKQEHPVAQYNLAWLYSEGDGVAKDSKVSLEYFTLSAEQRYIPALYTLGALYDQGKGVPQDYIQAYVWFEIIVLSGDDVKLVWRKGSLDRRDRIAKELTPVQIKKAKKLARDWMREQKKIGFTTYGLNTTKKGSRK